MARDVMVRRIRGAHHAGDGMAQRDLHWRHRGAHLGVLAPDSADELVAEALLPGVGDRLGADLRDPLARVFERLLGGAEDRVGQNGHLGQGVPAQHVGVGNRLGVAQLLGLFQGVGVGEPFLHPGEDVVGGTVEDSADFLDAGAGQRLADQVETRGAAHDRALVQEVDAPRPGQGLQLGVVQRQRALVGGHHVHAALEGGLDVGGGRLGRLDVSIGGLEHHVRLGLLDERQRVATGVGLGQLVKGVARLERLQRLGQIDAVGMIDHALLHVGDTHRRPVQAILVAERLVVLQEQLGQPLSHRPESDEQ